MYVLLRSCLVSSRPLHQSQNTTSRRMTVRSQVQSSERKVLTSRWITQEVLMKQESIPAQQHQNRATSVGSKRCLRGTKIPANSSPDRPDLTTKMSGINSSYSVTICSVEVFSAVWRITVIIFFTLGLADILLDINIFTTKVWTGICGDSCIRSVSTGATIRTRPPSEGWRPKTSRKRDREKALRSNNTNRW